MEGRNWLGFGTRNRTAQIDNAPNPNLITTQSDLGPNPVQDTEQRNLQRTSTTLMPQPAQKSARLSRISSFIGLGSGAKSHATTPKQVMQRSESMSVRTTSYHDVPHDTAAGVWRDPSDTDNSFIFKEADQTWHNPNLIQMMDTVSSAIMSAGIAQPIPRHLNSFVIGMIEEFRTRLSKQDALEVQLEDLRNTRTKEIQEFADMANEWQHREAGFKAEVKRLEHILADNDGVQSVVAARAGSMYNRNDAKAFQAKLNRLSKNEDENLGLDEVQQVVMEGEMRNFAVVPNIKDSDREIVLDHNADAFMCDLYRPGAKPVNKRNASPECLGKRMAAARQYMDNSGRPVLPSDNNTSKFTSPRKSHSTAPSSEPPSSRSSSLITQGVLAARVAQDHFTPHTTPPRPEPALPQVRRSSGANAVQARTGANALQTIQELMKVNGGLPEDAIDDDDQSSCTPSLLRSGRGSFKYYNPQNVQTGTNVQENAQQNAQQHVPQNVHQHAQQTIQELMKARGGIPEDVFEDDDDDQSSCTPSLLRSGRGSFKYFNPQNARTGTNAQQNTQQNVQQNTQQNVHQNAQQTIQELMKANGGLPENVFDDDDMSSFTPSLHRGGFKFFDPRNDGSPVHGATEAPVNLPGPQRPRSPLPAPRKAAPGQVDGFESDSPYSRCVQTLNKSGSSTSSSSKSSRNSCRSATLVAMAHSCVDHAGQSGGPDCPRNSPTKKVQSGTDPFPDAATKYRFRTERTVLNAHIREHSYMTPGELRAVMDDRTYHQLLARPQPAAGKLVHNPQVPRVQGAVGCPPGFEAHAAAGLLPFQQAAAQKAAKRRNMVKQAAAEKNEQIQERARAQQKKLT